MDNSASSWGISASKNGFSLMVSGNSTPEIFRARLMRVDPFSHWPPDAQKDLLNSTESVNSLFPALFA